MDNKKIIEGIRRWAETVALTIIYPLLKIVLGKELSAKITVKFLVGNDSYTDGRSVIVAITEEEALKYDKPSLLRILKFKAYHEIAHVLWSNDKDPADGVQWYRKGINLMAKAIAEEANKVNKVFLDKILFQICADLMNALEDGRIENLLCLMYQGLIDYRDWYRLTCWKEYTIGESTSKAVDTRNAILDIATMGILPQGFGVKYPNSGNFYNKILSLAEPIGKFVTSRTIQDGFSYLEKIARVIAPYFIEEYAMTEAEAEAIKKGLESLRNKFSEEELRAIAERVARESQNIENGPQVNLPEGTIPTPQNGPIVSVLKDNEGDEPEGNAPMQKPDVVVDLRKNPPKNNGNKSEEKDEDDPYYYRPEDMESLENETSDNKEENSGKSSQSSGKNDEGSTEGEGKAGTGENDKYEGEDSGSEESASSSGGSVDAEDSSEGSSSSSAENKGGKDEGTESSSSKGKAKGGANAESSSASSSQNGGNNGTVEDSSYQLPDASQLESLINSSLNDAEIGTRNTINNEIQRTKKAEAEWAKNSMDEAMPLEKGTVSQLCKDFGDRYGCESVNAIDYRKEPTNAKCPADILAKAKRLANKLETIIASKNTRDKRDCMYGQLDCRNLGKFVTGQDGFYKQKGIKKKTEMACLILKDDSGSMSGSNEVKALEVLAELEETFKIINFPLRMQAFSTMYGETMKVIKSWDDTNKNKSYTYSFHRHSSPNGGNNDAYSIALATDILCQRKEKDKLLIIVSDGAPCCSTELVKKAVDRARSKGVFVISILIGSERDVTGNWDTFVSMYGKNLLAGSLNKMGDQLFKFMKKFIAGI